MTVLSMGLNDRNPLIRKSNSTVLGHLIGCAKDSSIEKLLTNLDDWYMSREGKICNVHRQTFCYN